MRRTIVAKSQESVPPAPALMSRKQLLTSFSPENRHSISKSSDFFFRERRFFSMSDKSCASVSALAKSKYSVLSFEPFSISKNWLTLSSIFDFSLSIFCASSLLFQSSGSSDLLFNSANLACNLSGSKTPPNHSQRCFNLLD